MRADSDKRAELRFTNANSPYRMATEIRCGSARREVSDAAYNSFTMGSVRWAMKIGRLRQRTRICWPREM